MKWQARLVFLIVLAFGGCGGGSEEADSRPATEIPGGANPGDTQVIKAWSEALTEGDVNTAAGLFAIPSVAENGLLLRIRTIGDARLFNKSLPCGAELIKAESEGDLTTATFQLVDRPGPGKCPGTGEEAQTSFVIKGGKIIEWRRVATQIDESSGDAA